MGSSRRDFLKCSAYFGAALVGVGPLKGALAKVCQKSRVKMKFGLVTYLWGRDWDLPTLISNCEKAELFGVELRTQHAHGVESHLGPRERREVRKRFDDSPVTLVGLGTNFAFDYVEPEKLARDIEGAKRYIRLGQGVGSSGVKVKPNDFREGVPHEKTIEQIGRSLNALGAYGADYGQQIRLEVHGTCCELPTIKAIMDVADHPNVAVCWNSNDEDLKGEGLAYNFNLVRGRFGDTIHVRELNIGSYPYQELINLLVQTRYAGWVLLEARTEPEDRVKALIEQRGLWEQMTAKAQGAGASCKQK
jgi:hypothetical protein